MKSFYADLRAFQQKYPMVYVEAWTPEDFEFAASGCDEPVWQTNWKRAEYIATAQALYDGFDANVGTNWDRLGAVSAPV